jgi:hypothetical protein
METVRMHHRGHVVALQVGEDLVTKNMTIHRRSWKPLDWPVVRESQLPPTLRRQLETARERVVTLHTRGVPA